MIEKILRSKYRIATLLFVFAISILRISKEEQVYPVGDSVEYTLMTEALYNHFSADIRTADCQSFKELYQKSNKWEVNPRALFYDEVETYTKRKDLKKFEYFSGFFSDGNSNIYSCHFYIYSLINLPMRWICGLIHFNPLLIHQFTNILLLVITCLFFFKYSPFKEIETIAFVILFLYSTNYWYLPWQHPELFTTCFAALGFWLFVGKRYYPAVLLISIASLQNQPLAILVAVLCAITLFVRGINPKNILLIVASSVLVLAPAAFYYQHFGAINLIAHVGSIRTELVTFNRVFGFFFDLNQGAILALPFILVLYIILIIQRTITLKTQENKWDFLIPIGLVGVACFAATIDNWNSGQAVVNRYVTYVSGIILVHCFALLMQIKSNKIKWSILSFSILTQMITVYYHQSFTKFDWSGNDPKPISNWVLKNYPACYNPDPTIFISRYGMVVAYDIRKAPAYFMKPNGEITKFLVHKKYLNNLVNFGYSLQQVHDVASHLKYRNDWAYINVDEKFNSSFSGEKLRGIDNERRISQQISTIKCIPDWYAQVKAKAIKFGVEEEEMLRRDAAYVLGIQLKIVKSRNEIFTAKVNEIKSDAGWYKLMVEKAREQKTSIDSVIKIDASFMADQEMLKQENSKDPE